MRQFRLLVALPEGILASLMRALTWLLLLAASIPALAQDLTLPDLCEQLGGKTERLEFSGEMREFFADMRGKPQKFCRFENSYATASRYGSSLGSRAPKAFEEFELDGYGSRSLVTPEELCKLAGGAKIEANPGKTPELCAFKDHSAIDLASFARGVDDPSNAGLKIAIDSLVLGCSDKSPIRLFESKVSSYAVKADAREINGYREDKDLPKWLRDDFADFPTRQAPALHTSCACPDFKFTEGLAVRSTKGAFYGTVTGATRSGDECRVSLAGLEGVLLDRVPTIRQAALELTVTAESCRAFTAVEEGMRDLDLSKLRLKMLSALSISEEERPVAVSRSWQPEPASLVRLRAPLEMFELDPYGDPYSKKPDWKLPAGAVGMVSALKTYKRKVFLPCSLAQNPSGRIVYVNFSRKGALRGAKGTTLEVLQAVVPGADLFSIWGKPWDKDTSGSQFATLPVEALEPFDLRAPMGDGK